MESLLPGISSIQNIHPMFVHFPVAFFLGALAMEGLALIWRAKYHDVASRMLYLGTILAVVTLPTGFLAMNKVAVSDPRGHDAPGHDFIHIHGNWMVSVTVVSILLSAYLFWVDKKQKQAGFRFGFFLGLLLLSILLTFGADRGARLVYEFGTGINPQVLKVPQEGQVHQNEH
ncbi:MAG: DUF2231 domain-containing protein [Nitrospirae bacterium]|nr:DUF2231 domain-containing protein [Nitrospirota bacterium]